MKNACAYIRVSTDMQTEYSPDAQRRLILDYCKNNNLLITNNDFFEDIGISGTKSDNRPFFNEMIAACKSKEHPYDCVLVWKFSRFARNQEESIVYKRLLKKCNVDVISISEPLPDGFVGELVERIFEWMDEYYSINLSNEVMRGMTQKAMQGGYQGTMPFGYKKEKGGIPCVIEHEANVVKLIFNTFCKSGYGISTTAKYLNSLGIKTRTGLMWDANKIKYIINNPFYIGKIRWNYRSHKNNSQFNDESEWIISDGKHEPIISIEQFEQVQDKIKHYLNSRQKGTKTAAKHFLSGILKCANCGGSLNYRSAWQGRTPYFVCRNNQAGICKSSQYTKVTLLEQEFWEAFNHAIEHGEYKINKEEKTVNDLSRQEHLNKQLKLLDAKEARIKQAYREGIDTLEEYKENKSLLLQEKEKILNQLNAVQNNVISESQAKECLLSMCDFLKSDTYNPAQKNEALKKVLPQIVYDRDKQIMELHFSL